MAEQEIKISISQEGANETKNALDGLTDSIQNTGNATEQVASKTEESSKSFLDMSVSLNSAMEVFSKVAETLKAGFEEFNRQSGVMRNFHGSIDETSQRMNGLVSNIQLMEQANRIATTGLELTDHQFGNLTVAAQRYSQATGQDLTQSFEQLSEAVSEGSAEALGRFGIAVGNATDKSEVQEAALASLESQYGSLSAEANGATDIITRMNVAMENATTDFIEGINSSASLGNAFSELGTSTENLGNALGIDLPEGFSLAQSAGEGLSTIIATLIKSFAAMVDGLVAIGEANYDQAGESFRRAFDVSGLVNEAQLQNSIGNALRGAQQTIEEQNPSVNVNVSANTENATQSIQTATEAYQAQLEALNTAIEEAHQRNQVERENELIQMRQELISQRQNTLLEQRINLINQLTEQTMTQLGLQEQSLSVAEQIMTETEIRLELEDSIRQANFEKEQERQQVLMEQAQIRNEQMMQATEEAHQRQQDRIMQGVTGATQLLSDSITSAIQGEQKLGKAMKHTIDEWLKKFAIQQALLGAAALAEGISLTITNPPAAGTKYVAAAKHFALAGVAGGASAAIPNASGGSSGASSGGSAGVQPSTSPTSGQQEQQQQQAPIIINVHGMTSASEGEIGRAIDNALTSYRNRY